ncbi:Sm-like ribonucleo protein [Calocera viscosa TUFC12733]|uniref:U6 snRNA-associated Sm-like protein LSm1 n=1 Tax=Calocera viscosa (strain TUFC12733) TaxID=1330018 RepID=A0A167M485_CALVF|nr:Sm-like ribonucleo protein [Calocera viscosa TUFC12733]
MDSLIPFTTSGSLVDCVDKKVLIVLRDGRKLVGVLRSYDQFANLVLEDSYERIFHGLEYADVWKGVFVIRGENVVLLGEIDLDVEDEVPLVQVPLQHIMPLHNAENEVRKKNEIEKGKILMKHGFVKEGGEGDGY